MVDPFFTQKLDEVYTLCEQLKINELFFFGSSIDGKFIKGKSDLDVLVDTDYAQMKNVVRLSIGLSKIYQCEVDLFHKKWDNAPELLEYLNENKILVYERK